MTGNGNQLRSVEISCNIVQLLQERGSSGITEISDELGHSKSTIHDHLSTLKAHRLVVRDDDVYRLSLRFVEIAHHVKDQDGHFSIIQEATDELATRTGERAQFGREDYGRLIYLYRFRGDSDISKHFQPNIQEPLHCTALGKAMLAFMPQDRIDEIIDEYGLEQRTNNTITEYDDLMDELATIREQKYAIDDEEIATGLRCVAAPVTDNDVVIGSIGVSGPVSRLEDHRLSGELATQVKRVANVIEINSMFSE